MPFDDKLRVTREQYSKFIEDHDTIKQFERLFDLVNGLVSSRSTYDISDATDVTHILPDATTTIEEVVVKRKGAGTGKVLFSTVSTQTIEGLSASIWELEGEGTIVLFPSGGNWEVKDYSDVGSNSNGQWKKQKDGSLIQDYSDTVLLTTSGTSGVVFNSPSDSVFTFPLPFIGTPTEFPIITVNRVAGNVWDSIRAYTATNVTCRLNGSTNSAQGYLGYHANGRWRT